jgi:dTDP-4-dehydrorhamnose 3,5-epimerase
LSVADRGVLNLDERDGMTFTATPIAGAYVIMLAPHGDARGWLLRTYCKASFAQIGHDHEFVQMNHTMTHRRGTVRGMHFQHPPCAEIKLARCVRGSVYDVIVDVRAGSTTLLQWFGVELSAENHRCMYIPAGCAHGFQTLVDDCEMVYCHTAEYSPTHEGAVRYDDPRVGVRWPLPVAEVSTRDQGHALLNDCFTGVVL